MEEEKGEKLVKMFRDATPEQRKGMTEIIINNVNEEAARARNDWTDEYKAKERRRVIFWSIALVVVLAVLFFAFFG